MSRAGNITISILMWCAIAAYVVAVTRYGGDRRSGIAVQTLRIAIVDTATSRVVTAEKVTRWLAEAAINPIGRPIDSVDTRSIERHLTAHPEVKHANVWTDLGGNLTVRIEPRTPVLRIRTSNGYRFWFTDDAHILPDRGDLAAYVPVVTGNINFPFAPSAQGSYLRMRIDDRNDFLERFTAIETERSALRRRLDSARREIRATRSSSPKRWWSRSRKEGFEMMKAARIADLEARRSGIVASLAKTGDLERSIREKEKKSFQSYLFLSKLANFVEFVEHDDFWSAQIVQIVAVTPENAGRVRGHGTDNDIWREPHLELIPRAGNHSILLGELDGTETQRLENLRLFYLKGLWHEGWDGYGHINIKYRNQIVCTK